MALPILIGSQIFFTIGDLLARQNLAALGFHFQSFLKPWFFIYLTVRTFATFGQLYVFSVYPLGKTAALFGAVSILISNLLGFLLLNETLGLAGYLAVSFAVLAFLILAFLK